MWFKRKPIPPTQSTTIACETCGHIVLESHASFVLACGAKRWYCSAHRKAYDEYVSGFAHEYYYRRIRVESDGTPIGYTLYQKT